MGLMKHIRRALPAVMLLFSAVFCCGAGAQSCSADDIDKMFDPENLDMSDRPLEGIIEIRRSSRCAGAPTRKSWLPRCSATTSA